MASAGAGSTPPTGVVECDESVIGGTAPNTLSVDVDGAATVIPKEIFGVLLEILGNNINNGIYVGTTSAIPNTKGVRNDIIEGFREAGVGAIQWPGGCAANNYNWEPNLNPVNTMGTDLFMEFAELVERRALSRGSGHRPSLQRATGNGSSTSTTIQSTPSGTSNTSRWATKCGAAEETSVTTPQGPTDVRDLVQREL